MGMHAMALVRDLGSTLCIVHCIQRHFVLCLECYLKYLISAKQLSFYLLICEVLCFKSVLCYGWIDGRGAFHVTLLYYTA